MSRTLGEKRSPVVTSSERHALLEAFRSFAEEIKRHQEQAKEALSAELLETIKAASPAILLRLVVQLLVYGQGSATQADVQKVGVFSPRPRV